MTPASSSVSESTGDAGEVVVVASIGFDVALVHGCVSAWVASSVSAGPEGCVTRGRKHKPATPVARN